MLPLSNESKKALGAYYTEDSVARFLVAWGLGKPGRSVMDPSCGDGRFLIAAAELGAQRLVGCDIDPRATANTTEVLASAGVRAEIHTADFFELAPGRLTVDLIVGNPPFIRYQRFSGIARQRALAAAMAAGVRLTQLTSSWAPFLLHATQFLKPGGSLATVVPAEIVQTHYGLATLRGLMAHFESVQLIAFERNIFADAQAETYLLLAGGFGTSAKDVGLIPIASIADLANLIHGTRDIQSAVQIPLSEGSTVRFAEAFLLTSERRALHQVDGLGDIHNVGSVSTVINGYVSGANEFFHKTEAAARNAGLPTDWLLPTARNGRSLRGLLFSLEDIQDLEAADKAHHLVQPRQDLFSSDSEALSGFVEEGKELGVPLRFKCRNRDVWWKVPGLQRADVLVSYMSGAYPRAAVNLARAYYTNSLHGLRLKASIEPELLALTFYSSFTLLSLELEGRSYGGGILKLEPRELDRVRVAVPRVPLARLRSLALEVDSLLRESRYAAVVELVDAELLSAHLGVSSGQIDALRTARARLLKRRMERSRKRKA